jgi:Ca2+-binding RTX toxin-like protein
MTINNLHTVPGTQQQYRTLRIDLMRVFEGESATPYYDESQPRRHPTIGIGFNLDIPRVRIRVYGAMRIPPNLWAQLDAAIGNRAYEHLPSQAQRDSALQSALNQVLGSGQTFAMSQQQIADVFLVEANDREVRIINDTGLPTGSYEMLAVLSAEYAGLYGANLQRALSAGVAGGDDERAEAWYELRYGWVNTTASSDAAFAKRRYAEGALFGLYGQGVVVSQVQARRVYEMLQLHRERIEDYEARLGAGAIADGNAQLVAGGAGNIHTQALAAELEEARVRFIADFGASYNELSSSALNAIGAANIYLDPGRDSSGTGLQVAARNANHSALLNSIRLDAQGNEIATDDLLIGEGGADTLTAGAGNDILVGGAGNDDLRGGAGTDTYVYRSGDGRDWIRDSGRDGVILYDGITITAAGAVQWIDPANPKVPAWSTTINGQRFYFRLQDATADAFGFITGNLWIEAAGAAASDRIIVEDFRLSIVNGAPSGDLGLNLPLDPLIKWAVSVNGVINPFTDPTLVPPPLDPIVLNENLASPLALAFSTPIEATRTVRVSIADIDGIAGLLDTLYVVNGATEMSLASGYVDVEIGEGQSVLALSLVSRGNLDSSGTFAINAQLLARPDGTGGSTIANLSAQFVASVDVVPTSTVSGTAGNDTLSGLVAQANLIVGGGAGDILVGQDGQDHLYAEEVVDTATAIALGATGASGGTSIQIIGSSGGNFVSGGAGNDTLVGSTSSDALFGGAGADLLIGRQGDDFIDGDGHVYLASSDPTSGFEVALTEAPGTVLDLDGEGLAYVAVAGGADVIYAGGGNDLVFSGTGDDLVYGDEGNDRIRGGGGSDTLMGGFGDDEIAGDGELTGVDSGPAGADFIDGGDGNDALGGGGGSDTLYGGSGNDSLYGDLLTDPAAGNDYLNGEDGNDFLYGYAGNDTLIGGDGDDQLHGDRDGAPAAEHGNDNLDGGAGNDVLIGYGGADTLDGGAGQDSLYGDFTNVPEEVHGEDSLDGGDGNDTLVGGGGADTLLGGAGDDALYGEGMVISASFQGDDLLDGGSGNDLLFGGGGSDWLIGGDGDDTLVGDDSSGVAGTDLLEGGEGADSLFGGGGNDSLYGGAGSDSLSGGDGDDLLDGGEGDNYSATDGSLGLFGGAGNDTLRGGSGKDRLQGGDGNDILESRGGNDILFGQAGDDTYVIDAGAGAVFINDVDGQNSIVFAGAGGSPRVSMFGGFVYIDFTDTDYVYMDLATFNALQDISSDGGIGLSAIDPAELYEPGVVTDPAIDLDAAVASEDISFHAYNDDLIVAYHGTASDWVNSESLSSRSVMHQLADGGAYGLEAGTPVLVLTNWYRANPNEYVHELTGGASPDQNFIGTAYLLERMRTGTGSDDALTAYEGFENTIFGYAGDDSLEGAQGHDELHGGAGDDLLSGGLGDDTYFFDIGDGEDLIVDDGGATDIVRFGAGISVSNLTVTEDSNGLRVQVGPAQNGDVLTIANWAYGGASSIDRFELADGTVLSRGEIDALNTGDHSPRAAAALSAQRARPGQSFSYTIPVTAFSDLDSDALMFTVVQMGGLPLPSWLSFNPTTRTLSGSAATGNIGNYPLIVTATDSSGLSVSTPLTVTVPTTVMGTSGADFLFAPESGADVLGLAGNDSLSGGDGDDWIEGGDGNDQLYSGGGSNTLLGGAGNDQVSGGDGDDLLEGGTGSDFLAPGMGDDRILLNAGDGTDTLSLEPSYNSQGNDTIELSSALSVANLTASFAEAGGRYVLRLSYNPAAPTDAIDIGISTGTDQGQDAGIVARQQLGSITVSDGGGQSINLGSVFDTLNQASAANDILFVTASQHQINGLAGDDRIHGGQFADEELSGGDGNDAVFGEHLLRGDAGDDLLVAEGTNDVLWGGTGNDVLEANAGGDTLHGEDGNDELWYGTGTPTLDGGAGNDRYRRLSYVPQTGDAVTIVDSAGIDRLEVDQSFSSWSGTSNVSRSGNDLMFAVSGTPLRFSDWFVDASHQVEEFEFSDGVYSAAQIEAMITGTNSAPNLSIPIPAFSALSEASFSFAFPADTFVDTQPGSGLTYSASLVGGGALPAWLTFNPTNRTLSGASPSGTLGTIQLQITATDPQGLSSSTNVDLMLADPILPFAGTPGNDVLNGTTHDNIISSLAGNDTIRGLAGNDTLDGGDGLDQLYGDDGNDTLIGGAGGDDMEGGLGDDTFYVDDEGDAIVEGTAQGYDRVYSTLDYALGNNLEELILQGTASINADGNAVNNHLVGNSGDNHLNGKAGADVMEGGMGDDQYSIDDIGDQVIELAGAGVDTIWTSVSITLPDHVENLFAEADGIALIGNSLDNELVGSGGTETLDGGAGADTMEGDSGSDIYIVDNVGDVVIEFTQSGLTDHVKSSVSYTLSANVELLTLTGADAINGTGNNLINTITGNSAANVLNGGAGVDTLKGGAGDDTYIVETAGEVITELASEGIDTVQASLNWSISSAANLENITLTGTGNFTATGNSAANVLTGNSGNNTLTGNNGNDTLNGGAGNDTLDGGAGTDAMSGGQGDDVYSVDVAGDTTFELAGEGIDTVNSGVTRTLAADIEILFLTGTSGLGGNGNTQSNLVRGNTGNNALTGGGGIDILEGGGGTDTLSNSTGTPGKTLFNGGAGTDTITGTANNDLIIGGIGNDTLTSGQGADIIAFNKGDGQDTLAASTTMDNTLSIGGGALYADLVFQKSGNNLILLVGATDRITFTNYYASAANRSVSNLQIVIEGTSDYDANSSDATRNKGIQNFDFEGLVAAFDAARVANPTLTSWALTNALLIEHLSGSDTAAIGGDLAYRYGRLGNLADISFTPALGILGAAGFGTAAQTLQTLSSLQDSSVRLS